MIEERYNRTLKDGPLSKSDRVDQLCDGLTKVDDIYVGKSLALQHKILGAKKPSRAQKLYNSLHPDNSQLYGIEQPQEDRFHVVKFDVENPEVVLKTYILTPNEYKCNKNLCEVRCEQCPANSLCSHDMICTCPDFAKRNVCKHSHVLAMQNVFPCSLSTNDFAENEPELIEDLENHQDNEDEDSEGYVTIVQDLALPKAKNFEERKERVLRGLNEHFATLTIDAAEELLDKVKGLYTPRTCPLSFPKLDRGRKRERAPSLFPRNQKPKRRKASHPVPTSLHKNLLIECQNSPIDANCWMFCISLNIDQVLQLSNELEQQDIFISKFDAARRLWKCHQCQTLSDLDKNLKGFVMCDSCEKWFHCACTEHKSVENVPDTWMCPNCVP